MKEPTAKFIPFSPSAKFIVMGDCHRGDGSAADEFAHNSLIYKSALEYYLQEGFTYIELGDAEELWETESFEQIYITHTSVYDLLRRFHDPDPARTRYLKVWGNHDEEWSENPAPLRAIFPGIELHEAILLAGPEGRAPLGGRVPQCGSCGSVAAPPFPPTSVAGHCGEQSDETIPSILLLHGHQADPVCSGFGAKISRFLVHNVWSGLQRFGIGDPTRAAENPGRCDEIDETLYRMAKGEIGTESFSSAGKKVSVPISPSIIVAGHTHRPVFANLSLTERRFLESGVGTPGVRRKEKADPVYYNAGSCVHPRCITGIEITMQGRTAPRQGAAVPFDKAGAGSAHTQDPTPMVMTPVLNLVKWGYTAADGIPGPPYPLAIARTVLEK